MTVEPTRPNPALSIGAEDLVDEFTATGWDGDLRGALEEAPFHAPQNESGGSADWRPFFRDYLRDLPEDIRNKYNIRRP